VIRDTEEQKDCDGPTKTATITGIFREFKGSYPTNEFLLLKNLTCMKLGPNSMQTPKFPKTRNLVLSTPKATMQSQPKQVIE